MVQAEVKWNLIHKGIKIKKNQQQLQEDEWQTQRMINNNQQVKFHQIGHLSSSKYKQV